MTIEIRPVSAEQLEAFHTAISVPFMFDPNPESKARFIDTFEHDRLRAAFDGDQIVATFGAFSFQMVVPGNVLPMAGTTIVTVLPTHRRRGVMRALMNDHLADVHQRGEPLAALWASEGSIYGRFGYGPASEFATTEIDQHFSRMWQPPDIMGSMQLVDVDAAAERFPPLFDQATQNRPGVFLRTPDWWRQRVLADPESRREGATAHRRVLHLRDGQPAGYLIYRSKTDHETVAEFQIVELIGVDPEATKSLWQFAFNTDLTTSIHHWNQPVDDPLRWWLEEPRKLKQKFSDALWVRLVDVVAALSGRRYAAPGEFVFRLRDTVCKWNDGVFRLTVDQEGRGHCEPTAGGEQVELTPFALGAVYLGGHRLSDLARGGLATGSHEVLRHADALFTWDLRPWCQEIF